MSLKKGSLTKNIKATRKKTPAKKRAPLQSPVSVPEAVNRDESYQLEVEKQSEPPVVLPNEAAVPEKPLAAPSVLWGVALALGFSFDFLFWEQLSGLNYLIFLALCIVGGMVVLGINEKKPAFSSLLLLIPTLFFGFFTFWRREPLTQFLAYALSLFSIGVFAATYLGGRWYLYRLSTYLSKFFLLLGNMARRPIGLLLQTRSQQKQDGVEAKRSPWWGILRGLLISLPIVLCLGSLLASGDLVFNQKVTDFFEDFSAEKITEYFQQALWIAGIAYLVAGVFMHSMKNSGDEKVTAETDPAIKPFLGFTEAAVVLISICILFVLFVGVQFKYFFGGETNIGVAGYTYSQYARRGFNELITVAFISLMIVIGLRGVVRLESEKQWKGYTGLNVVLIALVLVILVSAYQRISLGIDWHGYSRLRLYPILFLIWLGALFVVVAALLAARREHFFAFALVLSTFGFAVTVSLFNIDAATVKHNVFRAWHGKNLNVAHLASLSSDAVPALVDEFLSPSLPKEMRDGVGAIVACYAYFEDNPHIFPYDWRSFNFSYYQAHIALEKVRPHLKGYIIKHDRHPIQVKTPKDILYSCVYSQYAEREEEE